MKKSDAWQDGATLAVAGWLFLAPFVLDFMPLTNPAAMIAWICAVLLYISASEALVFPDIIAETLDSGVGAGLAVSPWVLGYSDNEAATYNAIAAGTIVALCGISSLVRDLRAVWGPHEPLVR